MCVQRIVGMSSSAFVDFVVGVAPAVTEGVVVTTGFTGLTDPPPARGAAATVGVADAVGSGVDGRAEVTSPVTATVAGAVTPHHNPEKDPPHHD